MKVFFVLTLLFLGSQAFSQSLQSGDVIVQSFDCMECRLIQDETNSPYVHSGIIVRDRDGVLKVAEALGPVGLTPLNKFLARGKINSFFRSKEIQVYSESEFQDFDKKLSQVFFDSFWKLPFDNDFLWDNKTSDGKETLYCAEFVSKILNHFLNEAIEPTPMSYKKNYEAWKKIFRGNVPDGLPGISPSYFPRSDKFVEVELL